VQVTHPYGGIHKNHFIPRPFSGEVFFLSSFPFLPIF